MRRNKLCFVVLMVLIVLTFASGCKKTERTVWTISTGDKLSIEIDSESGFEISKEVPFIISKDGKDVSTGVFLDKPGYDAYIESIKDDGVTKIVKSDKKEGIEYTFYSYGEAEFNYLIYIENSNTAIKLENKLSKESAEEVFNSLNISLE